MASRSSGPTWRSWIVGWTLSLGFRVLRASWRVSHHGREQLDAALREGAVVLACWHGEQLGLIGAHLGSGFVPMVSWSRDGATLASALPHLGLGVLRGSSSRGGAEALTESLRLLEQGRSPALAVDGPRGPAGVPKAGAAVISARSGRPILALSARADRALRLRSWDRFQIPLPFSRVEVRYARLEPPAEDPESITRCTEAIRETLNALGSNAAGAAITRTARDG